MANAHFYSAAVDLPLQTLAPTISPTRHDEKHDDIKDMSDINTEEVDPHGDLTVHQEEMPEGPTVTRWEEWAYVGFDRRGQFIAEQTIVHVL
jgi:hypothetical protein